MTASTVKRQPLLNTSRRRTQFCRLLHELGRENGVEIVAWVVLPEHYHVVLKPSSAEAFQGWIAALHDQSAPWLNREDDTPGRQVWYQFWDRTLWTQGDLWSRINYVHANPVKHGHVEDARDWEWSSYPELFHHWCDPEPAQFLSRFPAPLKVRNDDF